MKAGDGGRVVPFSRTDRDASTMDELRCELRELRENLEVLTAETPDRGLPHEAGSVYRELVDRGMSRKLAAALLGRALKDANPRMALERAAIIQRLKLDVQRRLPVTGGIEMTPGACRVVAVVGTTGVGKTTNIAKLAAHYAVRRRAKVALVTADTYRVAAPDQLKVYADIIGIPLRIVNDAKEMASAIREFQDYNLTLIDTAGGSQFNMRYLKEVRDVLGAAQPDETILALGIGAHIDDLRFVIENFQCLHPTSFLFSKLDESCKYGVVFTLVAETGLPVGYLSIGQEVPDDIRLARSDLLANLIVEGNTRRGKASSESA